MNNLISVVIPLYNRETVMKECIDSMLSQSYSNIEVLLIDDGSSDKTLDICNEYAQKDDRVKVLCAEHGGVSKARNAGIDAATGDYILFIDSDDVLHPYAAGAMLDAMTRTDASIAGVYKYSIADKNWQSVINAISEDKRESEYTYQNAEETLDIFFHVTSPINLVGGVMMKRELIGETRFNSEIFIGEDFYFIYQNLIKGASSVFVKPKWYYYRHHSGCSSNNYGFSAFWSRFHRRELVWKSEESFGRKQYADIQKNDAYGCFIRCMPFNKGNKDEIRKICDVMKKYKNELFTAMGSRQRFFYNMYVNLPFTFYTVYEVKLVLRKLKRKLVSKIKK